MNVLNPQSRISNGALPFRGNNQRTRRRDGPTLCRSHRGSRAGRSRPGRVRRLRARRADAAERAAARATLAPATLMLGIESHPRSRQLATLVVPAVLAVRRELELPINEDLYGRLMNELLAKQQKNTAQFMAQVRGVIEGNSR